jgi:hypothetical protein
MSTPNETPTSALALNVGTKQSQPAVPFDGMLAFGIEDFCRASSLGRSFVYEQIASGALRTIKIGKRRLILADAARSFLAGASA